MNLNGKVSLSSAPPNGSWSALGSQSINISPLTG